jgi:hypothetical protein
LIVASRRRFKPTAGEKQIKNDSSASSPSTVCMLADIGSHALRKGVENSLKQRDIPSLHL